MKIQHLKKNLNYHIVKILFRSNDYSLIKNRNEKVSILNLNGRLQNRRKENPFFISKTALPFIGKSFFISLNLVNVKDSGSLQSYCTMLDKSKALIHIIKFKNFLLNSIKIFKIFFFLDLLLLIKLKFFFSYTFFRFNFLLSNNF